jgi:hypothetical protein
VDSLFFLTYPEYVAARELEKRLPKRKGYSVLIPLSRQQKGMDLLLYSLRTGRAVSVQVKGSRSYRPKKTDPPGGPPYDHRLWFKAFDPDGADFFALVGVFPKIRNSMSSRKTIHNLWSNIFLLLSRNEAKKWMKKIRRRAKDRFFYVDFDADLKRVALTHPKELRKNWTRFLLGDRVTRLEGKLG